MLHLDIASLMTDLHLSYESNSTSDPLTDVFQSHPLHHTTPDAYLVIQKFFPEQVSFEFPENQVKNLHL